VRLGALFALSTLLAVGSLGLLVYRREAHTLEETLGVQLLNIARTGALLIDPALHAEVDRTRRQDSPAYQAIRARLHAIRQQVVLPTPVYTLTDYAAAARQARFMVTSDGPGLPGEPYPLVPELIEPLGWTFQDGVARFTRIYRNQSGTWITAFAPVVDAAGKTIAVLDVDYPVEIYLDRLADLRRTIIQGAVVAALGTLVLGLAVARLLTRPIGALTRGVLRVAAGDLSQALPVRSADEVGQLTRAFNGMIDGLRQRDFIRDTFGRYVSPQVARTLLESPAGLRLGGDKREVTVLMSDLRGYTRLAEARDPAVVVETLNGYLGRMTEIIVRYGGTIDEFIGDAIFAVFGAPLAMPDHPARAAACALQMQLAMRDVNRDNAARGLPHLDMGIGLNTGEAVVGNIGSEQRAKYGVVGSTVNLAARVEASTVGGQILLSPYTYERIREVAEVGTPMPVQFKGIREPLLLYELQGLGAPHDLRLPEAAAPDGAAVPASLPLMAWVIEGKTVAAEAVAGEVVALEPRRLQARLARPLAVQTNLRLKLRYPSLGQDSADLYAKVLAVKEADGGPVHRLGLTSVDDADQAILDTLRREAVPPRP
jgi:sigma-B regulation protein RsbU (phosphoserine phosphatase)